MRVCRRLNLIACALCVCFAWTSVGRADDESKRTCAAAFADAQRLMRTGSLIEAKKKLVLCGGPQCPAVMNPDCQQWLSSVETSMPTVVFQVSSASGLPLKDVLLSVDGGDSVALDGRAVAVDPGVRDVTIKASGYHPTTARLVVSEGEKLRREPVTLVPLSVVQPNNHRTLPTQTTQANALNAKPQASRVTLPVIIVSSGAVLAGISAVYFGLEARADDRQLGKCTPDCTREAVDHTKREYLWTNLSIGLAAAGITTAAVLFFIHGHSAARPTTTALSIGVGPAGFGPMATGVF